MLAVPLSLAALGCAVHADPVADLRPPAERRTPTRAAGVPGCAGLGELPGEPIALLDEQIELEVPLFTAAARPIGGTGVPLSVLERQLDGGRVVFWATRFPARIGDPVEPDQVAAPYRDRWPKAEAVPLGDGLAIELHAEDPMPAPWDDLVRVVEVTRPSPGGNLWTVAVLLSRDLAHAEPAACRAAAERWALTVREIDGVRPVAGRVCVTGGSGLTSFTWTVPGGDGWFRVRRIDRRNRTTHDVLERWPLAGSEPRWGVVALAPEAAVAPEPAESEGDDGWLAGLPARWRIADRRRGGGGPVEARAAAAYGPDVLSVMVSGPDPGAVAADRRTLDGLRLNAAPCP